MQNIFISAVEKDLLWTAHLYKQYEEVFLLLIPQTKETGIQFPKAQKRVYFIEKKIPTRDEI